MFKRMMMMGPALAAFAGFAMSRAAEVEIPSEVKGVLRRNRGGMTKRDWAKNKSRYYEPNGKRECARRVRQMAAREAAQ